jgi:hypothetical protein
MTVAIFAQKQVWVRAKYRSQVNPDRPRRPGERLRFNTEDGCPESASIKTFGAIRILYYVSAKEKPVAFAKELHEVLTSSQGVDSKYGESDGQLAWVEATAPKRQSSLLGGWWWENYVLKAWVGPPGIVAHDAPEPRRPETASPWLAVAADLQTMVSFRPPSSEIELHPLDERQRELYAKTFNKLFADAIKLACKHPVVLDDERIDCGD